MNLYSVLLKKKYLPFGAKISMKVYWKNSAKLVWVQHEKEAKLLT